MAVALNIKAVPTLRDDHEARVQRAVAKALKEQRSAILDKLGDPPDLSKLDSAFWNSLDEATRADLEKVLRRVYLDSAAELIADVPVGVDWGGVNKAAAEWAKQYTYDLVKGVNNTTREALQSQIGNFYDVQGTTTGELRKQLEPLFGVERAANISVTETTRASVEGQRGTVERIKRESGVVMRAYFITDRDESVCPRCKPLDRVAANVDGTYTNPDTGAIEQPPPVHPYCRCNERWVMGEV